MFYDYYLSKLHLNNLVKKSDTLFNFRCPICKDSKKSQTKKRGFFVAEKDLVYCHNCGFSSNFKNFLKILSSEVHAEYVKDCLLNKVKTYQPKKIETNGFYIDPKDFQFFSFSDNYFQLNSIYKPTIKAAKDFLRNRKIDCFENKLYFSLNEKWFLKIIFPITDEKGIYGFQARTITKSKPKYVTEYSNKEKPFIYNYYHVNKSKDIFVFEGIIDSLFFDNSIAMLGSNLIFNGTDLENYKKNLIFVFDNDETGKKRTEKYLKKDFRIVSFPKYFNKYKDVNEIIMNENISKTELKNILLDNTLHGFNGLMKFKLGVK